MMMVMMMPSVSRFLPQRSSWSKRFLVVVVASFHVVVVVVVVFVVLVSHAHRADEDSTVFSRCTYEVCCESFTSYDFLGVRLESVASP